MIGSISLATSHILFPGILTGFIPGCTQYDSKGLFFSNQEMEMIKEIIDLIVPVTKTASASQVGTHYFLDEVFAKCFSPEQQYLVKEGISSIVSELDQAEDKVQFLSKLDAKAFGGDEASAWFIPIKQYTMIGFFTSQEGVTKASNYVPVPREYKGEIPLTEDTLNYGLTALRYYL